MLPVRHERRGSRRGKGPTIVKQRAEELRAAAPTADELAELARGHGLSRSGIRPKLGRYLRDLWHHRKFLWTLSSAESYARNQDNYLGQLWAVINPLLLAGAYFFIFGMLLGIDEGTTNYVGFLVVGLFLFLYSAGNLTASSKSISGHLNLIRSLRFPRALMPLSSTLTEFVAILPTLGVLIVLMFATGERPTTAWLLFPVVVVLHLAINVGLGLITARLVHSSRDLRNFVPLAVRLLRYISGVFFSIDAYAGDGLISILMKYQPFAVVLDIARQSLLGEAAIEPLSWFVALGWAIILPVGGLIFFWRAEATYGRN